MENKRMLRAVFILAVCFTIHLASGEDVKTTKDSNKTAPHNLEKLGGSRNESIEVGTTVTLLCTNVKIAWSEMIYVIWKINSHKNCWISVAANDTSFNTCEDEKKMYISTAGDYSLIIPDFSIKDEGNYTCDVSYRAGGYVETIHVSAWARPSLTAWLEDKGGHTFAVCEAQSKPAASIYWKTQWNPSEPKTNSSKDASGLFTVTSRLQLPQNASRNNLTCVVSASPHKWKEIPFNTFKYKDSSYSVRLLFILLGVCATCSIVTLLTGLYIMRGKIKQLSVFREICCTSQIPAPAKEEKTPQPRDPEEVEPYASYVQRVNSIYNSSAELFNA